MKKMHVKMSAKCLPFCTGLNVLKCTSDVSYFRMTYYTPRYNKIESGGILVDTNTSACILLSLLYPRTTKLLGGYIGFIPSVRLSIHPAFRVCSVAPTVLIGSISYLYILLSNFRGCVTC